MMGDSWIPNLCITLHCTALVHRSQMEGISVSVDDKLKIARELSNFGMHYIEGGCPGSNPKDTEFFARARKELPAEAWNRVVAFGFTRRKHSTCEADKQLAALIAAGVCVCRAVSVIVCSCSSLYSRLVCLP